MPSELHKFTKHLQTELTKRKAIHAERFPKGLPERDYLLLCGRANELAEVEALIKAAIKKTLQEIDNE